MGKDYDAGVEVGLRKRIAQAVEGASTKDVVDRVEAILGEYHREIEVLVEARKAVGDALLESGIAVRTGSEAESIRNGIAAIRSGLEPVVVVVSHSEDGVTVDAASAPVRLVSIDPQWYAENVETVTPERLEELLEGDTIPGDRAKVARAIDGLRADMEPHTAASGLSP